MLPAVLKAINNTEEHLTQGSKQASLLLKLVFARWMTTGFIIWGIRPFEETLRAVFLAKVSALLFADAFTTPVMRFMDIGARISHNYSAKKAATQEKMNSMFQGTPWFLAERYTDMTKTLFVSMFFGSLLPSGYAISCAAFLCCYWVDKYCLFRLWKQPPAIDASLTAASRLQIAVILVVHCVIACQVFAGFPFDHVSGCGAEVPSGAQMTCPTCLKNRASGSVNVADVTDLVGDAAFPVTQATYCDQTPKGGFFNVDTADFMTDSQKTIVGVYAILNVVLMVIVCVGYFGRTAAYSIYALVYGNYVPVGGQVFAGFPFDHVSGCGAEVPSGAQMTCPTCLKNRASGSVNVADVTDLVGDAAFPVTQATYCDQTPKGGFFNVDTADFMTDSQKTIVGVYAILNVVLMVIVCVGYFGRTAAYSIYALVYGNYVPVGDPNPDQYR